MTTRFQQLALEIYYLAPLSPTTEPIAYQLEPRRRTVDLIYTMAAAIDRFLLKAMGENADHVNLAEESERRLGCKKWSGAMKHQSRFECETFGFVAMDWKRLNWFERRAERVHR